MRENLASEVAQVLHNGIEQRVVEAARPWMREVDPYTRHSSPKDIGSRQLWDLQRPRPTDHHGR
ncbi:hypothetical protein [Streptomyces yokosukanensis]|nr:hypothetical protein [Streptomyces yokosukanensis]